MGRSSDFPLMKAAIDMKKDLLGKNDGDGVLILEPFPASSFRRPEFWRCVTDLVLPDPPYVDFPEPSLMDELLDGYFQNAHLTFPLLHRPTFLQNVASGLHLFDEGFGATVLLVCAVSARFSENPAVLPPGTTDWQWAGWQWFQQVQSARKLIPLAAATLYDLQVAVLAAAYIGTSSIPYPSYAVVGHGLRIAQDLGAHRRMAYGPVPTVDGELRKRAFWCLVTMDRGMCSNLGRPCSIHDEDFDLDYAIECDDEYWVADDPQDSFKQPPGKPSTVAFFNCVIRLAQIHARALRTIYSLQGSKILSDLESAQQMVAELDSELNKWVDSIPDQLKYDPDRENAVFATQSTSLYASYYNLRIFIHRPFITMPNKSEPLPFPSLTICTHAARSCIQVLDRHSIRFGSTRIHQHHQLSLFTSSIVLLLHNYSRTRAGQATAGDVAKELEYIHKALRIFKSLEGRWNAAGRFWDVLYDLLVAVDPKQRKHDDNTILEDITHPTLPAHAQQPPIQPAALKLAETAAIPTGEFPGGNFDFAMPPRNLDSLSNGETLGADSFWKELGAAQSPEGGAQPLFEPSPPFNSTAFAPDPELEAIFASLLPASSYEDPLAAIMPQGFASSQSFDSTSAAGAVSAQPGVPLPSSTGPSNLGRQSRRNDYSQFGEAFPTMWGVGPDGPP
ncbi:uncharacterized protein PHACADRAFT_253207 [Phanerochaete carnosa HHB-10118-sp]|uniref:Xylanolytic transcriptional activator regulatory domain-containing protein n=1 Tax=Phanerochaete carnosa (strain HHB-10118-sp) TaxID=650164 RepID=K5WHA7_PHACS|nr:uncharacterized protein PHACADRAFT_253207 [Phanerochaete carnosa HHB-10118-sp]EKM58715.1 hypothetical protein PHACADRAFT_253207 [Phanerochaete carnosa HHB-10118-sp]